MTVRTITGNINTLAGVDIPNATFSLVPETYVFGATSSEVIFGELITVGADANGDVSFDLHEGKYVGRISTSQGAKTFRLTVDSDGPWELGRLIGPLDAANIPPLISAAFDAADRAEAAAGQAEAAAAGVSGKSYALRSDFVADTDYVNGDDVPPDGTVVTAGGLSYVRSAGATAIADLPGWVLFGVNDVDGDPFVSTSDQTLDAAQQAQARDNIGIPAIVNDINQSIQEAIDGVSGGGAVEVNPVNYTETDRQFLEVSNQTDYEFSDVDVGFPSSAREIIFSVIANRGSGSTPSITSVEVDDGVTVQDATLLHQQGSGTTIIGFYKIAIPSVRELASVKITLSEECTRCALVTGVVFNVMEEQEIDSVYMASPSTGAPIAQGLIDTVAGGLLLACGYATRDGERYFVFGVRSVDQTAENVPVSHEVISGASVWGGLLDAGILLSSVGGSVVVNRVLVVSLR